MVDLITSPQQALADWIRRDEVPARQARPGAAASAWRRTGCRACRSSSLTPVLDLGAMPPANALLRPDDLNRPEPRYPLSLQLCQQCGMVQLGHVVPPELLFRSYLFFTSSSRCMAAHFSRLMTQAVDEFVPPRGLVVEIGSNDGTALSSLRKRPVRVLGIDPARNIAVMAAARGVPTISEFFTELLAREVTRAAGQAHLIVGCNVLGHVDDLDELCRGVKRLLAPGGALIFEVPYLGDFIDRAEYDTVYHEHLSYFAVRPLVALLSRHSLRLERVEYQPVHGGTIRCTARHGEGHSLAVETWLAQEADRGLALPSTFERMARVAAEHRHGLRERLEEWKRSGRKVLGYGAAAKGTVALNYCRIDTDLVPAVIDSTPAKQGWHIPGTHQLIVPPSALAKEAPDVLLLLAWNHAAEIVSREADFLARGGRFLTPHLEEPALPGAG